MNNEPLHPLETGDNPEPSTQNDTMGKPKELPRLYQNTLAEVFGFSPSDLSHNSMGHITRNQQDILLKDYQEEVEGLSFLLTIFLGVGVLLAFIFSTQGLPMEFLLLGVGIVLGWLAFYSFRRQARRREDARATKRVSFVIGIPSFKMGSFVANPDERVKWLIKDKSFDLTQAQTQTLAEYEMPLIKAYYTADSVRIVSAEVVDYPQDKPKRDLIDTATDASEGVYFDDEHDLDEKAKRE